MAPRGITGGALAASGGRAFCAGVFGGGLAFSGASDGLAVGGGGGRSKLHARVAACVIKLGGKMCRRCVLVAASAQSKRSSVVEAEPVVAWSSLVVVSIGQKSQVLVG